MGRRIVSLIVLALAVGPGIRPAMAQTSAAPGDPATTAEPPGRPSTPSARAIPWPGSAGEKSGPGPADPGAPGELPPITAEPLPPPEVPGGLPPVAEMPVPPTVDPGVKPAEVPIRMANGKAQKVPDRGPLPPAGEMPGQSAPAGSADPARESAPFVLPPEQLPMGRQSVGLTVEVVGPPTLNINQATTLKIVVKNSGTVDARGVVVRDELPDGLEFLSSQPIEQRYESGLFWSFDPLPAGTEKVITLRVKPVKTGSFDHAATVTMRSGSKARTIVREPKLKVEQVATSGAVLKGKPVEFRITVSNPGDGPAHNVKVLAKLSPGLREGSGGPNPENMFDQTVAVIKPGERVELEPLIADTILGDVQSCRVVATSPDVEPNAPDAESVKEIKVVEPKLTMTITGPDKRYTDQVASYEIALNNPGSAAARNVKVAATLPVGGRPVALPSGARFDSYKRQLVWTLAQLEPGDKEKVTLAFQVKMGGPGLYQVSAVAVADGGLNDNGVRETNVEGLADVELDVTEKRRTVDVGEETTFQIRIKNFGLKEASHLLLSAKLSGNLTATMTDAGSDDRREARYNTDTGDLVFPQIDRLGAGKEMTMGIKVKCREAGLATCRVFLTHDDLDNGRLEDVAVTKVTDSRR